MTIADIANPSLVIPGAFSRSTAVRMGLLLALVVTAEAVVVLFALDLGRAPIRGGDGPAYDRLARNVLDHSCMSLAESPPHEPSVFRTPGYPSFIALIYGMAGRSLLAVRTVQFGLLALTAWLIFLLASHLVGLRTGAIAALLCATYPPFLFQATLHLTETLCSLLTVFYVWLVWKATRSPRNGDWLATISGLIAGANAMVRPSMTLLIPFTTGAFLLPCAASSPRRRAALLFLIFGGSLVSLGPWTVRNAIVTRTFSPLGVGKGWSLAVSADQYSGTLSYRMTIPEWKVVIREYEDRMRAAGHSARSSPDRIPFSVKSEMIADDGYRIAAFEKFRRLTLKQWVRSLPLRVAYLWSPCDVSPWATGLAHRFVQADYLAMVILIAWGIVSSRSDLRAQWPLWGVPLYLLLIHLVFHVEPRYSLPGRPFLLVYAAVTLSRWISLAERRGLLARIDRMIPRMG